MERLTKHSKQTSHENGICCTHFRGPECLEVGGNCAMNCKWEEAAWSRLAAYEDTGLTPERCAEFARADAEGRCIIMRDAEQEQEGVARLRELAEADKEGRLFLLPTEPGRPMLCQEYFERPWVMKNVTLCVQYQSSAGIIFYMGYDVFRGLVECGRITPLSAEWLEKSLQAIVPLKPVSLCFAATMPDGEVYTGYYNADATDKAVIAHNIQADITMDIIRTNAAIIKNMIEHCEEDE